MEGAWCISGFPFSTMRYLLIHELYFQGTRVSVLLRLHLRHTGSAQAVLALVYWALSFLSFRTQTQAHTTRKEVPCLGGIKKPLRCKIMAVLARSLVVRPCSGVLSNRNLSKGIGCLGF